MSQEEQRDLYFAFLPVAAAVDVEIQSTKRLQKLLEALRREGKALIVSFHDFEATPSLAKLRNIRAKARNSGADIVKIATKTEKPTDVARLLVLLEETSLPLAVMGIGSLGRASRLLFANAGSVLNYGWLDQAQIAGQWSAREFLELLDRD
jgi:3-dehydroquinate dehydratase-1